MNKQAQPLKQDTPQAGPLDRLAHLVGEDMQKVNALIIRHMDSQVPLIPQIAAYLIAAGGKRIRPLLTLAATRLYGYNGDRPYALAASVEFIHTATLLHDDVVDESTQRRGKDAANLVFGNQASVLVGDFLFSRAFQLMVTDGSLDVLRILSEASAIIAEGEVMQLAAAGDLATDMGAYNKIIAAKTAALFAAACEIGPVIAGADKAAQESLRTYGHELGMAFQIADDILDYSATQEKLGKTVGDDFREGKLTAPVILALADADADERAFWHRTMVEKDQKPDDLATAQSLLARHNALKRGADLARAHATKAAECLANAPDTPFRPLLAELAHYTVDREF
ncbi:MAG: polyprenyl synthetase family protein [Alphaproteobacteria bacterium]|nr:polyprenyl synthetase family protein [Alphaproteobacteria bacterium]MBU0859735.1 polyprenyl synthetase family protein [Alphaproteobacteria bacterium]